MEQFNGIATFVRAAESSSFVAAGQALGLSASAVGKAIARLEAGMGARLFNRTTRRLSLTVEGAAFYERCRRILDDLRDAEAALVDATSAPRGRLRIGMPTIGYRFFLPAIPGFRQRYPAIELDVDFNDRLVDVVEEGLDAVIRSGPLRDSSLMSRRLAAFGFLLCAAPDYLERHGVPERPVDLAMHDCLRFRFPTSGRTQPWPLAEAAGIDPFRRPSPLVCNNMEALLGATVAGLGIACMPDFLVKEALAAGRLRTVLDAYRTPPGQFSIVWPSSRQLTPRLRVFIDYMSATLFKDNVP